VSASEPIVLLEQRVTELEAETANLRTALASRIVVEQAKGVLIERLDLPPEAAFELLRSAARRSRRKVHTIAAEILASRTSPSYIEREIRHLMAGNSRSWQKRS
jgi:AmiR/NasT family two-component response regulator